MRFQESACEIRGSRIASSSSMRSQVEVGFLFDLDVASRSITNCVAEVMACCDWRNISHD